MPEAPCLCSSVKMGVVIFVLRLLRKGMGDGRYGIGGRAMAKRAEDAPAFWAALNSISNGRIAPATGGVLTLQADRVIGSVGMSGDVSENDEACSLAGIKAAGLASNVGEDSLGKQ